MGERPARTAGEVGPTALANLIMHLMGSHTRDGAVWMAALLDVTARAIVAGAKDGVTDEEVVGAYGRELRRAVEKTRRMLATGAAVRVRHDHGGTRH